MQLIKPIVNNRQILYLDIESDLKNLADIELQKWVLLVIEDNATNPILWPFAELCIEKELIYMTAVGQAGSKVDDLFDEVMLIRELSGHKMPYWKVTADDVLMTSWNESLEEGFWFITTVANYEDFPIHTVVVANMTAKNHLPPIENLAYRISQGWLPSD